MSLPEPGDVLLGKYRISSVLGEGGFGRVYKAITMGTERPVAVKVLKMGRAGTQRRVERFLREMRTIARLQSAHTVTLFDFGRTDDGSPFMVCEYVEGRDLSELLAKGPLGERDLVHVLVQLLKSLAEAHSLGVLHRDLKPANVRVFDYAGDPLSVKLLDFGLVKSFDELEENLTGTGKVIGTPRFMSPEQITGKPLRPASDIYSLGLLAHEMIVGTEASRELPIGRPRTVPEGVLSPGVAAVIQRMLEVDESRRFHRAEDVVEALSPTRAPSAAASPAPAQQPRTKPSRSATPRHDAVEDTKPPSTRVVLLAVGIVALTVGGAIALSIATRTTESTPKAPIRPRAIAAATQAAPTPTAAPTAPSDMGHEQRTKASSGCDQRPPFTGFGDIEVLDGIAMRKLPAYLPTDYDPQRAHPVIFLLHESGTAPETFLRESRFAPIADREGIVLLAPHGGMPMAWEHDDPAPMIRDALADAEAELCLDAERIYLVGHSSGGWVAEMAPCFLPGVLGIATTAFRRSRSEPECADTPIPAIHLVGHNDGYNPIAGGKSCSGSVKVPLTLKEGQWRARNSCGEAESVWRETGEHRCLTWECEVPVVSCVLDGGRGWNGTGKRAYDFRGCDGQPADFDYAETIWTFFSSPTEQ